MSHPSELSDVFGKPFAEQVAFFRRKLARQVPTTRWDELQGAAHDDAFMVAGAVKADLLSDLASAVDKAIAEGRGIEDFRRDFDAIVRQHGWTGWAGEGSVKGEAWRVGVILRTNAYTSYAAGRMAQLREGKFAFWVYRHGGSIEPRPDHLSWDGWAGPPDHIFWATHYPPSDWGCSCYVVGARSASGVRMLGGILGKALPKNWQKRDPKTGAPVGIGKGWDYAPGASVSSVVTAAARKIETWPALIGAAFGKDARTQIAREWPKWVDDVQSGVRHEPGLLGTFDTADIMALEKLGQEPVSAEIWYSPGLIKGPKADRHSRANDALEAAELADLPLRLQTPMAVLFDDRTGNLIYVLAGSDRAPQLSIAVNYTRKRGGKRVKTNMVVSSYRPKISDIANRIKAGDLIILRGSVE